MANKTIYGKRRQGKSTLALALALEGSNRVIVFDPNGQFPLIGAIPIEQVADWAQATRNRPGYWLARVGPLDSDVIDETFAEFAEILFDERNLAIIVDEAHMLQKPSYIHPALDRWNRRSPESVNLIQTTHRIVDCHVDSRYHADDVFIFYAYLPRELKMIEESFGPKGVSQHICKLKEHHVLHWRKAVGGIPQISVWDKSEEWFINLENDNR